MVAHPDRVGIGKPNAQLAAHGRVILDHNIAFATDVLGRCLDMRPDKRFKLATTLVVDHQSLLQTRDEPLRRIVRSVKFR